MIRLRLSTILFWLVAAGCSCDEKLIAIDLPPCGESCYTGPSQYEGVGVCSRGAWRCYGNEPVCEGSVLPSVEVCDGRDNDCDGFVPVDEMDPDEDGYLACEGDCEPDNGDAYPGGREICNGVDDDCDGVVDNEDELPIELCYDGPPGSLTSYTICRPGYRSCMSGTWSRCTGQVTPVPEVCDRIDNDCDGLVDENLNQSENYDFVLLLDLSGSMYSYLSVVERAVIRLAGTYSDPGYRFALVGVPGPDMSQDGEVVVLLPLSSAQDFQTVLTNTVNNLTVFGTTEATYDGLLFIMDPADPLDLGWRHDAVKTAILFTDERGQSVLSPPVSLFDLLNAAHLTDVVVYTFTSDNVAPQFTPIAVATGGSAHSLNAPYSTIEQELINVVTFACASPE